MARFVQKRCRNLTAAALLLACCTTSLFAVSLNSVQTIIDDMKNPSDSKIHGFFTNSGWDTAQVSDSVGTAAPYGTAFSYYNIKGSIFTSVNGSKSKNTRIQIRNMQSFFLDKSNQWHAAQNSKTFQGGLATSEGQTYMTKTPDTRMEADSTSSVKLDSGFYFIGWPWGYMVQTDTTTRAGIFASIQARLIVDNPAQADDRDSAKYLFKTTVTWYQTPSADPDNWALSHTAGSGRLKWITKDWQVFNFSSISAARLLANPPPMDNDGSATAVAPSSHQIHGNTGSAIASRSTTGMLYDLKGRCLTSKTLLSRAALKGIPTLTIKR